MRSTFLKIFLSFWLTEFLIIVFAYFLLTGQFESNEIVYVSMFGMMQANSRLALDAYQKGGCTALNSLPNPFYSDRPENQGERPILFNPSGEPLCQSEDLSSYSDAVHRLSKDGLLFGERHGAGYLEGIEVRDAQGRRYLYLMRGAYPTRVYIPYREIVPRLAIGLIISLLVTFGITMVITRPIGSLRKAARQLAAGDLSARAQWPRSFLRFQGLLARAKPHIRQQWPKDRIVRKSGDELLGLVYDFNEMADRMESLVDAQMLLLRDVSHELRSPLARLSVALELAREEAQPGMEEQLDRIERETRRLNELIGQLLSLSHLESATRLPESQLVSVRELVEEMLPDMDYEAHRRNCSVKLLSAAPDVPNGPKRGTQLVHGSRELLGRAVENVIRNSISYTGEGTSVEIRLSEQVRAGDRLLVLEIRDYGPGVPEAALKTIFRPFYRLDLSRQRSTGGYGVGLAITERAIRLHGGFVVARNAPDGGLVVIMNLPLAEPGVRQG